MTSTGQAKLSRMRRKATRARRVHTVATVQYRCACGNVVDLEVPMSFDCEAGEPDPAPLDLQGVGTCPACGEPVVMRVRRVNVTQ